MSDRLISADKLMETIKAHHYPLVVKGLNSTDYGMFTLGIQQAVDEQPTVNAVRHGHWIKDDTGAEYCSNCHEYPYDDGEYHIANWYSNYCPHCGADMRRLEDV